MAAEPRTGSGRTGSRSFESLARHVTPRPRDSLSLLRFLRVRRAPQHQPFPAEGLDHTVSGDGACLNGLIAISRLPIELKDFSASWCPVPEIRMSFAAGHLAVFQGVVRI
jgi:hypothetical protein